MAEHSSTEREWTINVCPNCDKLLSTWPPENECQCEPPALGHSLGHLEIPVVEASRLAEAEARIENLGAPLTQPPSIRLFWVKTPKGVNDETTLETML